MWPAVATVVDPWPHEGVAPPSETRLQRVVREALDRLQRDALDRGERFSVRKLEDAHDIAQGTIGKLKSGVRSNLEMTTLARVAAALGVDIDVLTGKKDAPSSRKPPPPAPEPTPPPPTQVTVDPDLDALITEMWDPQQHRHPDGRCVEAFHGTYGRLSRPDVDPRRRVRLWLDTAARIRQRGEKATPDAMLDELMGLAQERAAELQAQVNAEAEANLRAHGVEPPKGPSAQAKALQESRKRRSR
jgi:transcriptional regulator with XRE-family HTH domain